jgi:hypothetical protein
MKPSPVSIDNDLAILACAATLGGARLPCHSWMGFRLLRTDELSMAHVEKRGSKDEVLIHGEKYGSWILGVVVG